MKLFITIMGFVLAGLTACSKSKPIEQAEVIGEWKAIKRWGKGPMTGSIVFRADGTCESVKLPWGIVTRNEADFAAEESIRGEWDIRNLAAKRVVWVSFEKAKSTGQSFMMEINPELRGGEWTFRQYIGDPDLMDIVEFKKQVASNPTENR